MIHVLARAQFAVGHVEEVGAPGDGAQRIPGLDVGARVVDVAVGAAKGHGHMAVGGHGENEQQLLEIGAMGLGVPVGDGRRGTPSDCSPRGGTEAAAKADRGAVVVQLVEAQAEALCDRHDDLGQQRCAVGIEESIQSAPEPVIAEALHLLGIDAEHAAGKPMHGLVLAVDGFALDDERAQQHAQSASMRDGAPGIGGDMPAQQVFQADALDEVIDKG